MPASAAGKSAADPSAAGRFSDRSRVATLRPRIHVVDPSSGSTPSMIVHRDAAQAANAGTAELATIFNGDCLDLIAALAPDTLDLTVSSPPYCMGKEYESSKDINAFIEAHQLLLPELVRVTRPGGSICWQVGTFVKRGEVVPLDALVYEIMRGMKSVKLRNRIVWTFGHGLHCANRFSGRHETILWFTKEGAPYRFDLDAVRVPQKYPGKRANKGPNKGEFSGNPLGKNPGDVWDIPNVKANHIEKTEHPCQFPVALVQRLVRGLTAKGDLVFDPFAGVASTGVAAILENRRFLGAEINRKYVSIAETRLHQAIIGEVKNRPLELDVRSPKPTESVARVPAHFRLNSESL